MAVNKVIINGADGETVLIDLTKDTVTPETMLEGVTTHNKSGEGIEGTMPYNSPEDIVLRPGYQYNYTIPNGYHTGEGLVVAAAIEGVATPTKETQLLEPDDYYYGSFQVNPIPDQYQDVTPVTAMEDRVFTGDVFVDSTGAEKTGTFTIEEEIAEQDSLIEQIKAVLRGKAAGGGVTVEGIPEGYAKVDFIQFAGGQYVDTGIVCGLSTKIKVLYVREGSTAQYLYGVVSSDNKASVTAYLSSSGTWRFGAKSTSRNISIDYDVIHLAVVDKSGIKHEGGTTTFSGTADFTAPGTLILGGTRQSSGACAAQFEGKVLLFEIWQDTEPVLKLMPVVNADGVYRFWDSVSETFFDSITDTALEGGNL